MDIFGLYKPFRNRLSKVAIGEALYVIWAYSRNLQFNRIRLPSDIEGPRFFENSSLPQRDVSEWELELIAKEVLLNAGAVAQHGHSFRAWKCFAHIINALRALENEIYGLHRSEGHVLIEMTRIAHRQFVWQTNRPSDVLLCRYYRIFSDPEIDGIAQRKLGLSVRDIYACAASILGHFLSDWRLSAPVKSEIRNLPIEKFERFFAFTSKSVVDLQQLLRQEQRYDDRYAYAYNSLRAFPLVWIAERNKRVVVCPIPTLLMWRVTSGLYYDLVGDPQFGDLYGRAFERYVGEVVTRSLSSARCRVISEKVYPSNKGAKRTVDWIVAEGTEIALFLECKTKRMKWDAKVAFTKLDALDEDIDLLAHAIVQAYKAIRDYRLGLYPDLPFRSERIIYPVVVTLENWHAFGSGILARLDAAVRTVALNADIAADLLVENPYSVWATEELEIALRLVDQLGTRAVIDPKFQSDDMRQWGMLPYMLSQFKASWPRGKLFPEASDEIFGHLLSSDRLD